MKSPVLLLGLALPWSVCAKAALTSAIDGELQLTQASVDGVLVATATHWQSASGERPQSCLGWSGRVAISVPRVQIRHPQQLVPGRLQHFDRDLTRLLTRTLDGEAQYAFARNRDDLSLALLAHDTSWVTTLGRQDASQYVLSLVADDLSLERPELLFGYFEQSGTRQFALSARLHDAFTGQPLWQQHYRYQADWAFPRQTDVDTSSAAFWTSAYGRMLQDFSFTLSQDVDAALACQPLKGRLLALEQDEVVLDMGRRQGIRPGDTLMVMHRQGSWGQVGTLTLTVTDAQAERARAHLDGSAQFAGLQVGDWVMRIAQGPETPTQGATPRPELPPMLGK